MVKKTYCYILWLVLVGIIMPGRYAFAEFENTDNPVKVAQQFDSLFDIYTTQQYEDPKRAKEAAEEALKLAKATNDPDNFARSYYSLGVISYTLGNYDEGIEFLVQGLHYYEQQNNKEGMCLSYKWLGNIYNELNRVKEGMSNLTIALKIAQENGLKEETYKINNNIGISFLRQEHYQEAIEHFRQGINYDADTNSIVLSITNLGLAYEYDDNLDKAGELYFECIDLCGDDENCLLMPLMRLIHYYFGKKEYEKSIETCFKVLELIDGKDMKNDLMITTNSIGLAYLNMGKFDDAILYFEKTVDIAKEINESDLYKIYANLSFAYEGKKDYKRSLEYLSQVSQLKDSLFNVEKTRQIEELMVKYENEKKEKEILQLKQESSLQESEISRQQLIRNFSLGLAFLILLSGGIAVWVYQQKIRDKNLLAIKTEEINKQRILDMLHAHEIEAIKASLSGQEKAKKEIAHELHDNIAGTLAGIKMNLSNFNDKNPNIELGKSITTLDRAYQDIRMLSHHLIPPRILNSSFTELVTRYVNEMSTANGLNIELILHPKEELNGLNDEVKVDIYRIIQELINNIVKHAKAKLAEIQITHANGKVNLLVEDDGIGFDKNKVRGGIGLSNIQSRVKVLNGTIDIDSVANRGSIFNIEIPINQNM